MAKEIIVVVDPPCISPNREMQYVDEAIRAYKCGKLASNMTIVLDTPRWVKIIFKR